MLPAKLWAAPLLTLALLALPGRALAAVERFVDEQGTVHIISNGASTPSRKEPLAGQPGRAPSPPMQAPAPEPPPVGSETPPAEPEAPPTQAPMEAQPPGESESAMPGKARKLVDGGGVIRLTNVPERPGNPVLKPAVSAAPAVRLSAGRPKASPNVRIEGRRGLPVARFQDTQGTIHITTAPAKMQDDLIRLAGYQWPAHLTVGPAPAAEPSQPWALAASPVQAMPQTLAKRVSVAAAASPNLKAASQNAGDKSVKRFRDRKGVVHIVSAPRRKGLDAPVRQAVMGLPAGTPLAASALPAARPLLGPAPLGNRQVMVQRDQAGRLRISSAPRNPALQFFAGSAAKQESVRPITRQAAQNYSLPVSLVEAVIQVESNFTPQAVSPKGAMGLMQLMPGTARDLGVQNPFCPRENVLAGSRYLRMLLNLFNQDVRLALAAYNAGFQRVIDCGFQVPPIKETQGFVSQVLGQYHLREKNPPPGGEVPL